MEAQPPSGERTARPIQSAEPIARVISDLRHDRYRSLGAEETVSPEFVRLLLDAPVVDATPIYQSLLARGHTQIDLYGDHPCIAPPWEAAAFCYVSEHGNVLVMAAHAFDARDMGPFGPGDLVESVGDEAPYEPFSWKTAEPLFDWSQVRWVLNTFLFIGGRSEAVGPIPTTGPVHAWQFAIAEDGEPLDLHWVHLVPHVAMESWDMAHLVLLGALNFANCRNIEIVEPKRERHAQRRLDRTGVRISTIQIRAFGRSTRSRAGDEPAGLTPLTSVRGHFACYGPQYGRGLLFGRLAGRFWIPQHARGTSEEGVSITDYRLVPPR
jgi:hypothetical protein